MFALILKGLIMGVVVAAPVGPIGMLCITRTLYHGFKVGFLIGLGAATADITYASVAAFGITLISSFMLDYQQWIQGGGGLLLLVLGIKSFFNAPPEGTAKARINSGFKAYVVTFFLALASPATIVAFIAVFASVGLEEMQGNNYIEATVLVISLFFGSLAWWLFLSTSIHLIRHKLGENVKYKINFASSVILTLFGIGAIVNAII